MRITALVLLLLSLSVVAQNPATKPEDAVLKIDTRLINLNVKVLDASGKAISQLAQTDFEVREDGIAQDIAYFQPVTAPVSLVLLLDLSGSTEQKRKLMTKAAQRFLGFLAPADTVAIAAFTDRYYWLSDFTRDRKHSKKAVEKIKDIKGGTAYYNAMWETLDHFAGSKDARKAIVVLTDGVDNTILATPRQQMRIQAGLGARASRTFDELAARVAEAEVAIYPLRLNTRLDLPSFKFSRNMNLGTQIRSEIFRNINERAARQYAIADQQLTALADETNGDVFPVDREEELESVFQRVAAELHLVYTLAYYPRNTQPDGSYRKIAVSVKHTGARAKTRAGYVAK
ncbi:MAG: VWA domain-containing protein [Blastocatellia bacterium]